MQINPLTIQNAYLTRMLKQAGLDAEAQVVAARIQSVLTDEIHHRMKNMLTMVTALVRQSMRSASSIADAEAAIGTRLIAMARAHDLLLRSDWKSAGLRTIIEGAVEQYNAVPCRICLEGEDIHITPSAILPLTLILNELCTNATKYGALSVDDGIVTLSWAPDAKGDTLVLRWVENGGPAVTGPNAKSFGTRLIEDAIPRQLGGKGALSFSPSGIVFELSVPFEQLKPTHEDETGLETPQTLSVVSQA